LQNEFAGVWLPLGTIHRPGETSLDSKFWFCIDLMDDQLRSLAMLGVAACRCQDTVRSQVEIGRLLRQRCAAVQREGRNISKALNL
jgi:hypothetical protein